MDTKAAATRWAEVWSRAWPEHDVETIVALYADSARYRALAFREPCLGPDGVRSYLDTTFSAETEVECRFGEPLVLGERAAVEWWASWVEDDAPVTLAGVTLLRFDADGAVVDHRDYWNQLDRREPPYADW